MFIKLLRNILKAVYLQRSQWVCGPSPLNGTVINAFWNLATQDRYQGLIKTYLPPRMSSLCPGDDKLESN